jgi:SPP1 gp7 family putative phage head morphogenesis protein
MPEITEAVFWEQYDKRLQSATDEAILGAYTAGATAGIEAVPGAAALVDWDVINQAASAYVQQNQLTTAFMTNTTRRAVVAEFLAWQQSGKPLRVLIANLRPWFSKMRAQRIAATEITRAYAYGNLTAWKASGLVSAKRWYTARDERVCPICGGLDGTIVSIDANFNLPQSVLERLIPSLRGRFNPVLAPPAHVNCRCALMPVTLEADLDRQLKEALQ